MSLIIGNGVMVSYSETELKCPICTAKFDASDKMDKAKYPVFKTKCPECKGRVGIKIPILGGTTKCFEWDQIEGVEVLETTAPFLVNGKEVVKKPFDDNSEELETSV